MLSGAFPLRHPAVVSVVVVGTIEVEGSPESDVAVVVDAVAELVSERSPACSRWRPVPLPFPLPSPPFPSLEGPGSGWPCGGLELADAPGAGGVGLAGAGAVTEGACVAAPSSDADGWSVAAGRADPDGGTASSTSTGLGPIAPPVAAAGTTRPSAARPAAGAV